MSASIAPPDSNANPNRLPGVMGILNMSRTVTPTPTDYPAAVHAFDKGGAVLVEYFTNHRAPCMVQLRVVSARRASILHRTMQANGYTGPADTALLQYEDVDPATLRDLDAGWPVRRIMDPWTVRHTFGWQAD